YASILCGRDGKETADIGRKWVEAGYTAVKFGWEPMGTSEAVDIDLVRGAREGLRTATLFIDAGCVYDARTALRRAHAFAEYKPEWFEEPLREDDVDGYVWLRDRSPVPIAAGEGECGRESFRELIDKKALDVYQVDLSRCGFTDAAYIRARVEEIGARLCNHCYTSPITVAASIHWLSTCRDAFVFEDCVEDSPLRHELTVEKVQSVDGWMHAPERPGLGVTLNEDFVRKYLIAAADAPRPNVVFILADDLGREDCGFMGGTQIKTPHVDKLAAAGAKLDAFYVQPVCSPTRAALMTGRYPMRHGLQVGVVRPWAQYGLPLDERTLPQALKEAGYATAIVGKWHLGHFAPEYLPTRRGFDRQYGHYNGALEYFAHVRDGGFDWHKDDKACRDEGYSTHLLARDAV